MLYSNSAVARVVLLVKGVRALRDRERERVHSEPRERERVHSESDRKFYSLKNVNARGVYTQILFLLSFNFHSHEMD